MFAYFHDMIRFCVIYRKMALKTSDFRDLFPEGAIIIVGTRNLPKNDFIRISMLIKMFCVRRMKSDLLM